MAELVVVAVEVPKELFEVKEAIVGLVKSLKAGKDMALIVSENLPAIIKALEGADKIPVELKDAKGPALKLASILAADLVEVL